MKKFLIVVFFCIFLFTVLTDKCFAKIKTQEKDVVIPACTNAGDIYCPKGFKPTCPKQYKPSCIFLGAKQNPACLADSTDETFFSYKLDLISCQKN